MDIEGKGFCIVMLIDECIVLMVVYCVFDCDGVVLVDCLMFSVGLCNGWVEVYCDVCWIFVYF